MLHRHSRVAFIYVTFGDADILSHSTVTMHTNHYRVIANICMSVSAQIACAANQMRVRIYNITDLYGFHIFTNLSYHTGIFMTDDGRRLHSFLCIIIPMFDMHIRTANRYRFYTNQHFIISHFRNRSLRQNNITIALLFFHNAFHHFHFSFPPRFYI